MGDRSEVDVPQTEGDKDKDGKTEDSAASASDAALSSAEATEFCSWFKTTLASKVSRCKTTNRLTSSPAVVTDSESGAMRRMMRMVETQEGATSSGGMPLPKQTVEINPNHEIIVGIHGLKETDPELAKVLAEQVLDNCLVAAGLMDDGRAMLPRLNDLMLCVVKSSGNKTAASLEEQSQVGKENPKEFKDEKELVEEEKKSPEESKDAQEQSEDEEPSINTKEKKDDKKH